METKRAITWGKFFLPLGVFLFNVFTSLTKNIAAPAYLWTHNTIAFLYYLRFLYRSFRTQLANISVSDGVHVLFNFNIVL